MVRLRLLGGAAITVEGRAVTGSAAQRHRIALLALLVRSPMWAMNRERLAACLWPDAEAESSRNLLRVAIHTLRRELGADSLLSEGSNVRLNATVVSADVETFEAACKQGRADEAAIALYTGDFLDGFHLPDALEFERWLDSERSALRGYFGAALVALAESCEQKKDWTEAQRWWQRAAAHDPYNSSIAVRLMQALASGGDVAGAIRHARIHQTLLTTELGIAPAAAVLTLERELSIGSLAAERNVQPAAKRPQPAQDSATVSPGARAPTPDRQPARRVRRRQILGAAALLVGMALLVLWPVRASIVADQSIRQHERAELRANRVLVLPLETEADAARLATLSRMAADWVTQGLQRSGLVEVIDPNTAFQLFADVPDTARRELMASRIQGFARATRARFVVWGSAYQVDTGAVLQLHVSDARAGKVLRILDPISATPNELRRALEEVGARVSGALATVIDERLATIVHASSAPPTFEAYSEFSQGMDLFFSQDLNKAARHFARAAELDSTFVTARFWQAYALQRRRKEMDSLITAISPLQDRLPPVERAGLEAFIAETRGDWQSAYRAHKRAAQLAPQSNWAYMAAYSALQLDRPREALELLADLDPTRGWLKEFLGYWQVQLMALHRLGEYGKQLAVAQSLLKLFVDRPTSGWRVDIQPLIAMAALGSHRDLKESVDSLEREAPAKGISAGAYSLWAAEELRAHGYLEEAARHFVRCVELQRQNDYCLLSAGRYAEVYAKLKPLADSAQCTAQDCPAWPLLGRFAVAAAHLGRSEEAQTTVERIQETAAGWQAQAARVRIAALLGQTDRASELLRDLIRQENFRSDIWSWLHFMLNSDLVSLREHWRADPIVGPIVRIGDQKTAARRAK